MSARRHLPSARPAAQRGVVLIIALVMLVVISLLTTLSIRSAASSESVSGNVRTTEMATQAAEIALRYCEEAVLQLESGTVTFTATPTILDFSTSTVPRWRQAVTSTWDVTGSDAFVIPTAYVNSGATDTYKRRPECLVERIGVINAAGTALSTTSTYVITARGFGPEVPAANAARSRPKGTEVWMQSTIEIK